MKRRVIELVRALVSKVQAGGARVDSWAEKSTLNHADKHRDAHFYTKFGWRVLVFGFGGFLLWASFAPIDRGVTANGWVITDGQRKVVQSASAGLIEDIYVREGDQVKAGELLVKLNEVNATAGLGITQGSIIGLESQINALQTSISQRKMQLANLETLAKEGYVPRNRVLELKGMIASEEAQLQGLKKELVTQNERLAPATQDLKNTELRSPVDGYVVNLQVFTKGGVTSPGAKLLEVVPNNQPLVVEARLPVHLIDKVHEGLEVEMLFVAFNRNTTPHIPGLVTVVGDDRILDERTGEPYFKVLAEATPEGVKLLGDHKVRPGMPVDLFVKTGERTMMSYLLKPLLDRIHSSLREE